MASRINAMKLFDPAPPPHDQLYGMTLLDGLLSAESRETTTQQSA